MEERVCVVRGRQIEEVAGGEVRRWAAAHRDVVVDIGTGDGRWLYALARRHADFFCVGVDATADLVREVSRRAQRKPARGGAPNLLFVRAAAETLPGPLASLAGEVHIQYPWGSLLRAVVRPEVGTVARLAALLRPRGRLYVLINVSGLRDARLLAPPGMPPWDLRAMRENMLCSYPAAGLAILRWDIVPLVPASTWAKRLGQGRSVPTLRLEARRL